MFLLVIAEVTSTVRTTYIGKKQKRKNNTTTTQVVIFKALFSFRNFCLALAEICWAAICFSWCRLPAYSCFEKGCPTKPYATMPKGIMGKGVRGLGVSAT